MTEVLATALKPGARFHNYEVERLLGHGGMGAVYLARDVVLGRAVVVKVILGDAAEDPALLERFRREAQAGARIDSDHVVKVFEVGRAFDTPFIAMEFVDGLSLADVQLNYGKIPAALAASLVLHMARGLVAAHAAGIVHRDVKPANALLCRDGRVKLADFGLAKFLPVAGAPPPPPDLTKPGTVVGTASYIAPEQAQGSPVDGRADVYALGVSFYELLTRKLPFVGSTLLATLTLRFQVEPDPPRTLDSEIPPELERLCLAMMALEAERRPTAREVVKALERLVPVETQSPESLKSLFGDPSAATQKSLAAAPAAITYGLEKKTTAPVIPEVRAAETVRTVVDAHGTTVVKAPARSNLLPAALFAIGSVVLGASAIVVALIVTRAPAVAPPPPAPASATGGASAPSARRTLIAAIALRDSSRVLGVRDGLRDGAPFEGSAALVAAATDAGELLKVLETRARELEVPALTGALEEVFKGLADAVERKPGTRLDRDVRAAATLLGAVEGRPVPLDLFLPRDATGEASEKLRRTLSALGLDYPAPR